MRDAGAISDPGETTPTARLLRALRFAAERHRGQRRKDVTASPYINHPIRVAEILAAHGLQDDVELLQAAALHDTIEDTETTPAELERRFGPGVRALVLEVTDDKRLPKRVRKELQVRHAAELSERARQLKVADKIANIEDVASSPPAGWSLERRAAYFDWAERVVAGCRGANAALERRFDAVLSECRAALARPGRAGGSAAGADAEPSAAGPARHDD